MAELYFIERDSLYRGKPSPIFCERDPDRMSLPTTILDIIEGQFDGLRRVYRWDTETHSMIDVSEDIAREVLGELADEPTGDLLDFLEEHLGSGAVAEYAHEREWEAA